jgi:hypothetical protein
MKKALIVSIIVVLLLFMAAGCTRNNTPGNTVSPPETILPSVTDDLIPDVDDEPLGTVSPDITDTPGDVTNSPGDVTDSPGLESPGVTGSPTAETSPAAG